MVILDLGWQRLAQQASVSDEAHPHMLQGKPQMPCPMKSLTFTSYITNSRFILVPSIECIVLNQLEPRLDISAKHCCTLDTLLLRLSSQSVTCDVQVPQEAGQGHGTEFGMHLELVETGYEDKKVRVKTKEANPAKQVHFACVPTGHLKLACIQEPMHCVQAGMFIYINLHQPVKHCPPFQSRLQFDPNMLLQAAKILKDIVVQQLSLYWKASNKDESASKTSSMESDAWQHVERPASTPAPPYAASQPLACTQQSDGSVSADGDRADVVLLPTKCELTISISTEKQTGVTHLGANAKLDRLEVQVHQEQISDMVFMQDQCAVWLLRNQYATLRPTGWRSSADKAVPPRQVILAMFAYK